MSTSHLKSWPKEHGAAKTCPMSRYAAMIANELRSRSKGGFGMLLREAGHNVDHMADTIEATVVDLWKARRFLEWEELPTTNRYPMANGHWVPISTKGAPASLTSGA